MVCPIKGEIATRNRKVRQDILGKTMNQGQVATEQIIPR
jgi:hypothetical protein